MRVAFLSDVHANLPALEAALAVAGEQGAERVVVAGDLVGEGPHPVEVVRRLRGLEVAAVRGNADRAVLEMGTRRKRLLRRLDARNEGKRNRAWTALQLLADGAAEERAWLDALPADAALRLGGRDVRVVHGSPLGDTDYVYPSLTPVALRLKLAPLPEPAPQVLVCGHSHVPFAREVDGVLVVNCGSVGRPADGDPRGSLALLDLSDPEGIRYRVLRFPYPVDETVRALEERGVPGIDPDEYRRGVKT